jgi:predicted nucleic acid-binding protein
VSASSGRGPVVIDTDVFGADLGRSALTAVYEPIVVGRRALISFQTVAELRYGAIRRQWGARRMRELEAKIATAETVHSGPELVLVHANLRAECERIGHALGQREHNADRWVASTALRLGIPLVSNDAIFENVPGLILESARP